MTNKVCRSQILRVPSLAEEKYSGHGWISDVHDGELYRTLSSGEGPLQVGKAVSFTFKYRWCGIISFNESEVLACSVNDQRASDSIQWEVKILINLLFALHKFDSTMSCMYQHVLVFRKLPKNMILAGLWFDQEKAPQAEVPATVCPHASNTWDYRWAQGHSWTLASLPISTYVCV